MAGEGTVIPYIYADAEYVAWSCLDQWDGFHTFPILIMEI